MEEKDLLTVIEAAEAAGMTESGIRDAMRRGALPHITKYRVKLIARDDLQQFRATVKMGRPRKEAPGSSSS